MLCKRFIFISFLISLLILSACEDERRRITPVDIAPDAIAGGRVEKETPPSLDKEAPTTPKDVSLDIDSGVLSWSPSTDNQDRSDELTYVVEIYDKPSLDGVVFYDNAPKAVVKGKTQTKFQLTDLALENFSDGYVYIFVKVIDSNNNSSDWSKPVKVPIEALKSKLKVKTEDDEESADNGFELAPPEYKGEDIYGLGDDSDETGAASAADQRPANAKNGAMAPRGKVKAGQLNSGSPQPRGRRSGLTYDPTFDGGSSQRVIAREHSPNVNQILNGPRADSRNSNRTSTTSSKTKPTQRASTNEGLQKENSHPTSKTLTTKPAQKTSKNEGLQLKEKPQNPNTGTQSEPVMKQTLGLSDAPIFDLADDPDFVDLDAEIPKIVGEKKEEEKVLGSSEDTTDDDTDNPDFIDFAFLEGDYILEFTPKPKTLRMDLPDIELVRPDFFKAEVFHVSGNTFKVKWTACREWENKDTVEYYKDNEVESFSFSIRVLQNGVFLTKIVDGPKLQGTVANEETIEGIYTLNDGSGKYYRYVMKRK